MTPLNHLRTTVAIRTSLVCAGLGLGVYSLILSAPLEGWLPRLLIVLSVIGGFSTVGFWLPPRLIKAACARCQGVMREVNDSDPVSYRCGECGHLVKTDWARPSQFND